MCCVHILNHKWTSVYKSLCLLPRQLFGCFQKNLYTCILYKGEKTRKWALPFSHLCIYWNINNDTSSSSIWAQIFYTRNELKLGYKINNLKWKQMVNENLMSHRFIFLGLAIIFFSFLPWIISCNFVTELFAIFFSLKVFQVVL